MRRNNEFSKFAKWLIIMQLIHLFRFAFDLLIIIIVIELYNLDLNVNSTDRLLFLTL
jgi:hypothetical protein